MELVTLNNFLIKRGGYGVHGARRWGARLGGITLIGGALGVFDPDASTRGISRVAAYRLGAATAENRASRAPKSLAEFEIGTLGS